MVPKDVLRNPIRVKEFLAEIDWVCYKHGYSISHEDGHGAFQVEELDTALREWLLQAEFRESK